MKNKAYLKLYFLFFILLLYSVFYFNVYANFFITEVQPNPSNSSLEFLELYFNNTIFDNNTTIILKDFYSEDIIKIADIYIIEKNNSNVSLIPLKSFFNSSFLILNSSMIISEYPLKILENKSFNKSLIVFLNSKIGNGLSNTEDIVKINFSNSNFSFYEEFYYNNTTFNKSFNYDFENKSYFLYYENPMKVFYNNFTEKFDINIIEYEYNNSINSSEENNTNITDDDVNVCFYDNISILLDEEIFEDKIKFKIKNNTFYNNSVEGKYYYYYYFTDLDENNITKIKESNTNYYKSFTPKSLEKDNIFFLKVYYYNPCNKSEIIKFNKIVLYKNNDYEEKNIDENIIEDYENKIRVLEEENNNLNFLLQQKILEYESLKEKNNNLKTVFIKSFYTRQKYYKENNSLFYTLKQQKSFEDNISYELYYCNLEFLKNLNEKEFNNSYYKNNFYTSNVNNLYLFLLQKNLSNNKSKIYYYKNFNNKLVKKDNKSLEENSLENSSFEYNFSSKKNNSNFSITSFVTKKIVYENESKNKIEKEILKEEQNNSFDFYSFVLKYSFIIIFFFLLLYLLIKNRR